MNNVPVPARNWKFFILDIFSDVEDDYVEIEGVTTFSYDSEMETADISDFSSDGWKRETVTSRGKSLSIDVNYMVNTSNGSMSRGQELLNYYSKQIGSFAECTIKMYDPIMKGTKFNCIVNPKTQVEGGVNDATTTSYDININGQPEYIPYMQLTGIVPENTIYNVVVGSKLNIPITFTPSNASNTKTNWSSSNESVVIVNVINKQPQVIAVGEGSCVLKGVSVNNNITCEIDIVVGV